MAKRRISPKTQRAAEVYLASLDSSREQLADKQWEIVAGHLKGRQNAKWIIPFFLIVAVTSAGLSFLNFEMGNDRVASAIPLETKNVILTSEADGQSKIISSVKLINSLEKAAGRYFVSGAQSMLPVILLLYIILIFLYRRAYSKTLEAFIRRRQESIPPPNNSTSLE